ncbi:MAG: PKD domain-containing protein [Candidatus Acidiferrales bacterium]
MRYVPPTNMPKTRKNLRGVLSKSLCLAAALWFVSGPAHAQDSSIRSQWLSVTAYSADGSYEIACKDSDHPVVRAAVAAQIDHAWIKSADFPHHEIAQSKFNDALGSGSEIAVTSMGRKDNLELKYVIRLYDAHPYGDIQVDVHNGAEKSVTVQSIRPVEAMGDLPIHLGDSESSDRVLSDSFSEDWPPLRIYDLGKAPKGLHLGVGSQLIYNRESKQSLFFGALTSDRFLTILHLNTKTDQSGRPSIGSFTVDSTGTTEIQSTDEEAGLLHAPAENRVELSLPIAPGAAMSSERLMFTAGDDYHAQLENYGAAIRILQHALVNGDNLLGWWSWTAFYQRITSGDVLTNAQWLSQHLRTLGYDYLHIDEGYQYARGEYTTPDATRFPEGMLVLEHEISRLGLRPAIWTAPFEVTQRAWVYENHKDWLVHNARGEPISVGEVGEGIPDHLFVLDATNPGAQEYLRKTYRTLVREWGIRYIKLDFMDTTAIEGYYHRPNTTALEAQRIGLQVIRKAVGDDVLLDKDGSPMLNVVGLLNEGRVSTDTGHAFSLSKGAAPGIFSRYYMNRNFFLNDPDAFTVSEQVVREDHPTPLTFNEAQVSIVLAAISGGMFEIGDDLPTLGLSPERLALVENPDLLQMAKLGRSGVPLDLLSYRAEDEQPSVSLLREDSRQAMLAVFNWTDRPATHAFDLADLKLPTGDSYEVSDVLNGNQSVPFSGRSIRIENQQPHSVKLLKIIDTSIAAAPPEITTLVATHAKRGETVRFAAETSHNGVPGVAYRWSFGDGVTGDGTSTSHAYTYAGTFTVSLKVDGVDGVPAEKKFSLTVSGEAKTSPPMRYAEPEP